MTVTAIKVGILDSGCTGVVAQRCEFPLEGDAVWPDITEHDHGNQVANIIRHVCPTASLYDARALVHGQPSSAAQIAQALDWLVAQQVHIVNLSLGLRQHRQVLADAIERAAYAGIVLVASAPAAGATVYPAAYPNVLAVTGDARCSAGVFTDFGAVAYSPQSQRLDFGAAPGGPNHQAHDQGAGSSFACAHVTAKLAQLMSLSSTEGEADNAGQYDSVAALRLACQFKGRECRH